MFVVVGESLIDLVPGAGGSLVPIPGGGPYNFARALALQGVQTAYLNPFSEDAFGTLLRETLAASGAHHAGGTSPRPTSLALVSSDAQGKPQYAFYREGVADRDLDRVPALPLEGASGLHTGGLALVPPDHAFVMAAIREYRARGAVCSVDANMRPHVARSMGIDAASYRQAALAVVGAAHVAKVSDEDLHHLGFAGAPQIAARALLHRGCRLVVLTLGREGAWAIAPDAEAFEPAHLVDEVDTVGAGDCFYAGFIAALSRQHGVQELRERSPSSGVLGEALRHAAACAAINIGHKGCSPPTWEEARRWQGRE
jgi:fructokinase